MLFFCSGTDRRRARAALGALAEKHAKEMPRVVVTDAHTLEDLRAALGGGMFSPAGGPAFGGRRAIVLDGVLGNDEMRPFVLGSLPRMREGTDVFFMLEEKVDAATKRLIERNAERSEKFDADKKEAFGSAFAIGSAMRRGDKKGAWVALQRELAAGRAPEAIHGVLFWAAKDMALKARAPAEVARARDFLIELAELPHRARRQGFDLDCALELFLLARLA